MLIQCEKCSTRYNLDEAKIPGKGAKVTCPTCKHVFIVMKGQQPAAPGAAAPPAAPAGSTRTPTNPPGKSLLDNFFDDSKTVPGGPFGGAPAPAAPAANLGAGRGIRSWKVRVASGLVYDFTDVATLKAWIAEKKVTTADQISADGATWTVIGTIPNLDAFFGVPSSGQPTPQPAPSGMGAPGPAPMTGFGPTPSSGPAAPAFAAPASPPPGGGSLADLFNAPAPGGNGDPFASAPAPAANPFGGGSPAGANPFGGSPTPTPPPAPSAFGGQPPAAPSGDPFAPDPFASAAPPAAAPSGNPFGGPDPFAPSAPPAASPFGGDPFGAAPGAPPPPAGGDPFSPGGDPFGSGAASPFGAAGAPAAPPPPMMGPKPAPPPWLAGPAPAPTPAAPEPPSATTTPTFAPAIAKANTSWSSAGDVTAKPAAIPTGKGGRRIGRAVGMALGGIAVLGVAGGLFMNLDRVQAMFRPVPTPAVTPTPPPIVMTLDGEARDHYLRGRRLLRLDTAEAYAKAEQEFRDALAKANGNPKATAGVLESLALQKQAGAAIDDAKLSSARDAAILALREDPQSVETNRALAQAAAVGAAPQEALPYLETALASRPTDAEALFLRSKVRSADAAQAAAAAEDLAKAASDATLTRAVLAKAEGAKPKSPEKKAADELAAANAATLAALSGGTWAWTPEEFEKLLPGAPIPTPTPAPATPAPVESAVAVTPAATPEATSSAAPTPTAVAVTPTPAKTPIAVVSATPAKTPLPAKSPKPTRTPLAATTGEPTLDETPAPTPVAQNTQIATASASDHFIAAQAFEQAASYDDAISEYQQAIKLAPKSSQYKLGLAGAQMRGRKFQDAATTLAELIEVEPGNAGAHRLLGLLFETTGQSANACAEFTEYLRLRPQAADAGDIRTRMVRNGCG